MRRRTLVLSPREQQIHDLYLSGRSERMIANELGVSRGTVNTHTQEICDKKGLDSIRAIFENECPVNCPDGLSQGQALVLQGLAQGKRRATIAQEMNISLRTVDTHARILYKKLNIHSRYQAIQACQAEGGP